MTATRPRSASRSSGSAGWGRCTPERGRACSTTTRTARCGRASSPWPTPTRTPRRGHGRLRLRRRPRELGRRCSSATTSTWSASAGPTSCTARSAIAVAESGRHLWIEKPAGRTRRGHLGDRRGRAQGGRRVGGRLQLPQRPGGRGRARAGRLRAARRGRDRRRRLLGRLLRPPGPGAVVAVRPGVRRHRRAR